MELIVSLISIIVIAFFILLAAYGYIKFFEEIVSKFVIRRKIARMLVNTLSSENNENEKRENIYFNIKKLKEKYPSHYYLKNQAYTLSEIYYELETQNSERLHKQYGLKENEMAVLINNKRFLYELHKESQNGDEVLFEKIPESSKIHLKELKTAIEAHNKELGQASLSKIIQEFRYLYMKLKRQNLLNVISIIIGVAGTTLSLISMFK